MEFLETFIRAESLIMIPVLYLINLFLKQTPRVPLWVAPWVLLVVGVGFCLMYYGMDITAVVQGILVAGAAVLLKDIIHLPIQEQEVEKEVEARTRERERL